MYPNDHIIYYTSAISCLLLLGTLLLVQIVATDAADEQQPEESDNNNSKHLLESNLRQWFSDDESQLERRSDGYGYKGSGGGYSAASYGGGGRGTQVAISLERVKNPDDHPYKKKKFPITWLRNQYPFNAYYSKKKGKGKPNGGKYGGDQLVGQYSYNEPIEMLDPNPSTWVKIPERPTATIKLQKQHSHDSMLSAYHQPPLPPPPSLQFAPSNAEEMSLLMPEGQPMLTPPNFNQEPTLLPMGLPAQVHLGQMGSSPMAPMQGNVGFGAGFAPALSSQTPSSPQSQAASSMMTSESQDAYSPSVQQQQAAQEPSGQSGFGGISLSFGNGRSISFGGGQGLTIGGRAGAISIGGKGSDNTPAASGYSAEHTNGGGYAAAPGTSAGSSYGTSSAGSGGGNGYGDNGYVNKHPTMSMDFPRKGKTIVHANLDMAPFKMRLHSSPRVKITTGSRDPLEKPSDEELAEDEEDIFEPPEPFPKRNATSANETDTANTTTTTDVNGANNGTIELTTLSPMQLEGVLQNGRYRPTEGYGGQHQPFYNIIQQQQVYRQPYSNQQQHQQTHLYQQQQQYQQQQHQFSGRQEQQFQQAQVFFDEQQQQPIQQQQQQQHQQQPFNPGQYQQQLVSTNEVQQHPLGQQQLPIQQQQQLVSLSSPQGPQYQLQEELPVQQLQQQQIPVTQQQLEQVPFNGQPIIQPQQQQMMQLPVQDQQLQQPPMRQMTPPDSSLETEAIRSNGDQRLAVNTWRQFSREARPQMNRSVPNKQQDLGADENPRFYNGGQPMNPNSIVDQAQASSQQPKQQLLSNGIRPTLSESPDLAASGSVGAYTKVSPHPSRFAVGQAQAQAQAVVPAYVGSTKGFAPSTITLASYKPVESKQQQQPQQQQPIKSYAPSGAVSSARQSGQQQQPQVQAQESRYHASSSYSSSASGGYHESSSHGYSTRNQQDYGAEAGKTRTYTFGGGGFSTHDDNHAPSSGSYSYGSGGTYYSDGFDRKNYDAKVEKFDPEAHDKRDKSKVILFLRPRISIQMANSSTTTKRPKNRQRFLNVITHPIFLNTTNTTGYEHDEEFIDPDLKEPMEINYNYGYGYGGNSYYGAKPSSSTTKKPKPKTTTTTTSTTAAPESTTESTGPSTSSDDSTSTTASTSEESSPTTTTAPTTSTEALSSSSTSSATNDEPSSSTTTTTGSSAAESSSEGDKEQENSELTTSATRTTTSTTTSAPSTSTSTEAITSSFSTTTTTTTTTEDELAAADLVSAATEPPMRALPSTTTTTTTVRPPPKAPIKVRIARPPSTTSTTSTTTAEPTTTSTEAPSSTSTTPTTTTTTVVPAQESSTSEPAEPVSRVSASTSTTELSSSAANAESELADSAVGTQAKQAKRGIKSSTSRRDELRQQQQQPMLLNAELIDKLMSNKTLVNLMSSQLKRVIDTSRMNDEEKHNIVRQVFHQMMEEKVDFSMNNVRLAVKTVSSSYRAAAEKQRKRSSLLAAQQPSTAAAAATTGALVASSSSADSLDSSQVKGDKQQQATVDSSSRHVARVDLKGFGRRALSMTLASDQSSSGASARQQQQKVASNGSKSFPVIDTALKLTKGTTATDLSQTEFGSKRKVASSRLGSGGGNFSRRSLTSGKRDARGNPIVVVLLPQEKA